MSETLFSQQYSMYDFFGISLRVHSSLTLEDGYRYTHSVAPSPRRSESVWKSTGVGADCELGIGWSIQ